MTERGWLALLFGVTVYVVAWATGSKALYPVAVGLVLAVAVAWLWMKLARRPSTLAWGSRRKEHYEGEDVQVEIEVALDRGLLPPAGAVLVQRVGKLGERTTPLERRGETLTARYVIDRVPRGRYVLDEARAVLEDPFGLDRVDLELESGAALLVYPRITELDALFSDEGLGVRQGVRLLLHRPSGYDIHSVREYEQGESLRRVHWPSTAKRGQLMVRELEDSPRDEVAVLLDASGPSVGTPPDSSFDLQVRAAGSILRAHVRRGKRALLAINQTTLQLARVSGEDGDWLNALQLLAAVEPAAPMRATAALADGAAASSPLEAVVVTSQPSSSLVEALVRRSLGQRRVSLVYVDASSFAGEGNGREPGLLRLQAAGVPVAVLRRGDDLATVLGEQRIAAVQHG